MGYIEETLGKKYPRTIAVPDFDTLVEHIRDKSLFLYGNFIHKERIFRQFFGIGKLTRIEHNEYYDLVYVKFGETQKSIAVVVCNNHARRQLLTCKKGWYLTIYGYAKSMHLEKNVDYKTVHKYWFYAVAIQGWYVPTMLDIKKDNLKLEVDSEVEKNENLLNFIDEIKDLGV